MTLDEAIKLHEYIKDIEDDYNDYPSDIYNRLTDIEYKLSLILEHFQIKDELE